MSRMVKNGGRRARRVFSEEFRAGAVRLVLEEGKSAGAVARDLDLTESALRAWVARAQADRTKGKSGGLTTVEREELARLRKENRQLRLERDVLKKGSSRNSGERRADFEEEVAVIAEPVGHALEYFDLVVHALEHACVERILAVGEDPREFHFEPAREGD